jgi:hypothetical protein
MPAPKMPVPPTKVTATAAAEALDTFMANRPGWASNDVGWTHDATGITVQARHDAAPFKVTRSGTNGELGFTTRTALDMHLAHAGA